MTALFDSLFLKAAADGETEAAAEEKDNKEEIEGKKENDDQSSKPGSAGTDAVHDNGGDELPEKSADEDTVLSEGGADAGTAHTGSKPESGGTGEGSSTEETESKGSTGGKTADTQDGPGGEDRDTDGRKSDSRADSESGENGAEPETRPEPETEPETVSGQEYSERIESLIQNIENYMKADMEAQPGEEEEPGTETMPLSGVPETEAYMLQGDLQQIHTDLQVICSFIVVFLIIILCHYVYKFFNIFF